MISRLVSALLLSTHLAGAALPEAEALLDELSAAHGKLPGYVATWHAEGENKTLDLTVAEDFKTGRFAFHLRATSSDGKNEARQWSPDGKQVFVDRNGTRGKVDAAEIEFWSGFGEIFLGNPDFGAGNLRFTPAMLVTGTGLDVGLSLGVGGKPGWSLLAGDLETAETADGHVTFNAAGFGRLKVERATGVLLRQEVEGEEGEKRVLELTGCRTEGVAGEIARMTEGWTTLGATDVGLGMESMVSRLKFLQVVVEALEEGAISLENLEEKMARKDDLLEYGRRCLLKSPRPVQEPLSWDKALDQARSLAHKQWTATVPGADPEDEAAFAAFLKEPDNRTKVRDALADAMAELEGLPPLVLPSIYGPKSGDGLKAGSAAGRVAKKAIETALVRAYLAAMLEEKMAAAWGERDDLD